ncbi:MAG: lanthionine biosynthesis protein, partial [Firmicutes bacterium]|nr:lanthionine biosynthesis protein [Bacillota bacterium]
KQLEIYLKDFSAAEWEERFQLIHRIDHTIKELSVEIGKEFVHEILLYEDTIYRGMKKTVEINEQFLENISQLQKYARIFDQSYPVLLRFSQMFHEKFGDEAVRADNLDVYQVFVKAGSDMTEVWKDTLTERQENNNDNMQRIYEMKKRFKEFIYTSKGNCTPVSIKEFIDREVAENEDLISEEDNSSTVFFQKGQENYVINKIYNGKQIFFSRFVKLFDEVMDSSEYQAYIDRVFGDKVIEITECFGFNANVHVPVSRKRLVLPLTDRNDPQPGDIELADCYFRYNSEDGRVRLYHDTLEEIKVVYLGSLAYYLLPTIMKTIMGLCPSTRFDAAYMNFWRNEDNEGLIVDRVPEIVYDNMVLIRKQCLIRNIFDMNQPVTELYREVVSELHRQGLPNRFFIKAYMNKPGFEYLNMGRTQLKPQYIDLGNILLFKEFCAKLEKEEQLIIEEIMPYNEEDDYIHEYQVEYSTIKQA